VGQLSVQFDHYAEIAVIAVAESEAPVRLCESNLALRGGQSVRALYVAVVTEFEYRMGAARRSGDNFVELYSPAKFLAPVHLGSQRPLRGEPYPKGTCYPAAGLV